jgi:hypothetical protein
MNPKFKTALFTIAALACLLSACAPRRPTFAAPEIEPPADLIPSYVPEGFTLGNGFQLEADGKAIPEGFSRLIPRLGFDVKSPAGNDIQGVYYQNENQLILITKSYFPGGTLDLWRAAFEESLPKPCECECERTCECGQDSECACRPIRPARTGPDLFPGRFKEFQEERTIEGTRVAVLNSGGRWITVFMRGEYLLTVEGGLARDDNGIPLEENLKIVASLLGKIS